MANNIKRYALLDKGAEKESIVAAANRFYQSDYDWDELVGSAEKICILCHPAESAMTPYYKADANPGQLIQTRHRTMPYYEGIGYAKQRAYVIALEEGNYASFRTLDINTNKDVKIKTFPGGHQELVVA